MNKIVVVLLLATALGAGVAGGAFAGVNLVGMFSGLADRITI